MDGVSSQILVVDDDAETRKLISALLQGIGLQSILVKGGETALTLLNEGLSPSLIILDLEMPDMDGFEVLLQIRRMSAMHGVPVLLLSATADPTTIRRGLTLGADAYVTKSYLTHSLVNRVRVLVAAGRQSQAETRMANRTAPLQLSEDDLPKIESPIPLDYEDDTDEED